MAKKETASPAIPVFPMLKTVEQMSKISGIGENKLRELMDSGELEYRLRQDLPSSTPPDSSCRGKRHNLCR